LHVTIILSVRTSNKLDPFSDESTFRRFDRKEKKLASFIVELMTQRWCSARLAGQIKKAETP
jgi:hypothetical protein